MKKQPHLALLFASLLLLVSCSGGGSSNSDSSKSQNDTPREDTSFEDRSPDADVDCSDEFGDLSRCDARESLP